MSRTVTIVAKGPSAVHAQRWIDDCPGSDVATINEAGLILRDDQPIRFGFFVHQRFLDLAKPLWGRIDSFVSPAELIGPNDLPPGFPRHRHIRYAGNTCGGTPEALRSRLLNGFVTHHHTVAGAMSWLAKVGYKQLRIIGVGGGRDYAPGFSGKPNLPDDLQFWPGIEATLASLLEELYGVTTERYQ